MDILKLINYLKKIITSGVLIYIGLSVLYVFAFVLIVYFKKLTHDSHLTYIIVGSILIMLNINIMSIVFILKFNKILHKLNQTLELMTKEE